MKYVGSPYQTSLAEERQDKYFCMLERLEIDGKVLWKEVEQWSIDLQHARRYFKVNVCLDFFIVMMLSSKGLRRTTVHSLLMIRLRASQTQYCRVSGVAIE